MKILGVILARSGSKGLPNKNTLPINNKTLIEHSVESSLAAQTLSHVIFSTDDNEYAQLAKSSGVKCSIIRPSDLASDRASTWDVVRHAVEFFEEFEQTEIDIVAVIQPTTPLRTFQHIDKTVLMVAEEGFEAAMTVREVQYPLEWMFWINERKQAVSVLSDSKKISRRQDAAKVFQPAGTAYAVTRRRLYSDEPLKKDGLGLVKVPYRQSINIDTIEDYYLAKIIGEGIGE